MREIKFRGKSKGGEWVYGDLETRRLDGRCFIHTYSIHTYSEDRLYYKQFEILPETIGQYTGLRDVKGKEIYEGDLVKNPFSEAGVFGMVTWHSDGYFYLLEKYSIGQGYGESDHRPLGEMLKLSIDGNPCNFKVIGNIHDNQELIQQ